MRFFPRAGSARPFIFMLAVAAAGCASNPFSSSDEGENLQEARRAWSQKGYESYTFTVRQDCFCVEESRGPFRVTVIRGSVASVTDPATGAPRTANEFVPLTVEALFDRVEQAMDDEVDELDVRYDAGLGYPRLIEINRSRQAVDAAVIIEASELTPVR